LSTEWDVPVVVPPLAVNQADVRAMEDAAQAGVIE